MGRHLGYRLLIDGAAVSKDGDSRGLAVSVDFRNVGFAPLYTSPDVTLVLTDGKGREVLSCPMDHDLTALSGGPDAADTGTAQAVISLDDLPDGVYYACIDLEDPATGTPILLANEQERTDDGWFLGTVTLSQDGPSVVRI